MEYPIVEVFGPTLQGEGFTVGRRTMFVRFGYCDGAGGDSGWCKWCDSLHAVDPKNKAKWKTMSIGEIKEQLHHLAPYCKEVTLSGGNPAIYNLAPLIQVLNEFDYRVNLETQGTIYREWMTQLDVLTVSPKPPSAGPAARESVTRFKDFLGNLEDDLDVLDQDYSPDVCVKVPVDVNSDGFEADYQFAKAIFIHALKVDSNLVPIYPYLSIVTHPEDTAAGLLNKYRSLAAVVNSDKSFPDVAVLPQLHVMLWGHKLGV